MPRWLLAGPLVQAELELGVVPEEEAQNALARLDEIAAAVTSDDQPEKAKDV